MIKTLLTLGYFVLAFFLVFILVLDISSQKYIADTKRQAVINVAKTSIFTAVLFVPLSVVYFMTFRALGG